MGLGSGTIDGTEISRLYGLRPTDDLYVDSSGLVFNPQTSNSVAYYEVTDQSDKLEFRLPNIVEDYDEVVVRLFTVFGTSNAGGGVSVPGFEPTVTASVYLFTTFETDGVFDITSFDETAFGVYSYMQVGEVQ